MTVCRSVLRLAGALLAAFATLAPPSSVAQGGVAAAYPERPIRIVVGFGAGGLADINTRLVAERLSPLVGKPVVVENVPGAGGVAAANTVIKARPDGHTLFVLVNGHAASRAVFKAPAFDPDADFAPISLMAYFDLVLLTRAASPYKTLGDLVSAAKAAPGKLNFGSINPGSTQNLSAELFKSAAGVDLSIVPYKGTPDLAVATLGGQLDLMVESYAAMKSQIDGGALRPLASTGAKRSGWLPDVPTVKETGLADYEVTGWNALVATVGTPPEVIALLNRHVNAIVNAPEFKSRLLQLGTEAHAGSPEELRRQVTNDVAKWRAIIRKANLPQL